MWSTRRRRVVAVLAAAALPAIGALATASPARAGEYIYWTCHTPTGQVTSIDGWTASNTTSDGTHAYTGHTCAAGGQGAISAVFGDGGGSFASGTGVLWSFAAPAGTRIAHVNLRRDTSVPQNGTANEGDANNGTTGAVFYKNGFGYDGDHVVEACQRFTGCTGAGSARLAFDNDGPQSSIGFEAGCYGDVVGSCNGVAGAVRASASVLWGELHLVDASNPTVTSVGGSAVGATALKGTESLTFNAADVGSGVWQAQVTMDGTAVSPRATLDTNDGRCVTTPYYGGAYAGAEFGYAVPCKAAVSAALSLDTTRVANGSHLLQATVWDAAGNSVVAVSQRVDVENPASGGGPQGGGAPNGTGADLATAHFTTKKKTTTRSVAYGSKVKLTGTLRDKKGKAVKGAAVDVLAGPIPSGATGTKIASVTTDKKGRFTYLANTLADNTVVFGYATALGSSAYLDGRTVNVRVHTAVSLKASRASVARGRKVVFTGTVKAGILPRTGAIVKLRVLQQGRWVVGAVVHTDAAGRFRWTHTFRVPLRYGFKAEVLETDGLSVRPGSSALIHVRVR
ncbi:MAG: hypothetical protein AAGC46_11395 [Solirubrobacteraceae bacterium]|nr:hypothetical protein [Patulibacter sp.]